MLWVEVCPIQPSFELLGYRVSPSSRGGQGPKPVEWAGEVASGKPFT